nr:MFS transporter [Limosilactobacillus frumenti]
MISITKRQRTLIAIILLLASFISLMSQTMVVTAIPVIQNELQQPLNLVQWLTTGYTLVLGITTPLSANLYERYNNRQLFSGVLAIFIVGTLLGCVAPNFLCLLIARLIQAAAGGVLISFQMTVLVSIYPPEKRGTIMGLSSLVIAFGPAIGPTLAGVTMKFWGWRSIFWVVLPFMIIIWLTSFVVMPVFTHAHPIKLDKLSILELVIGPGLFLASFSFFDHQLVLGCLMLVIGVIVSIVFYKHQANLDTPLLDFTVFRYRPFRLMLIAGTFLFMTLLSAEQMISVFAQNSLHVSSMTAGLILFPGAFLDAITGLIVGRLYDRIGVNLVAIPGLILCILTTIPTLFITDHISLVSLTLLYIGRMVGIGMAFVPTMSESYLHMRKEDIGQATALSNALRQMAGALAVTMVVVISDVPSNPILGMRWSMGITLLFAILSLAGCLIYSSQKGLKQQ